MSSACEVDVNELSRDERRVRWGQIINQMAQAYGDICRLPCISAFTYDPDEKPNRELSAVHIEYKVDVENAVNNAIGNDLELFKQWIALVEGDNPSSEAMLRLSVAIGPSAERNSLQPYRYFRRIRKGRPDRRPVGIS
jgi:hypothetical protein